MIKKWLKKNWPILTIGLIFMFLICSSIDSCVSDRNYKKQIKVLDKSIDEKEKKIKASEGRVDDLWMKIRENEDRIAVRDERIKEKDKEITSIRRERDSWKGKVEEMTPSEVVIETRGVLNCANIFERPDGVLFSLECAKVNLRALNTGEFSLAIDEVKKLNEKVADMTAKDVMKNAKITDLWAMIIEKDSIIASERGAKDDWKDKFDLSEKKGKKAWAKGRKEGTIIGGAIVTILWIFLGK